MAFRLRLRGPDGKQHTSSLLPSATLGDLQQEAASAFSLRGPVQVLLGFPPMVCTLGSSTPIAELLQSGDSVLVREGQVDTLSQGVSQTTSSASQTSATQQTERDEALARRLVAEEGHISDQNQIEAVSQTSVIGVSQAMSSTSQTRAAQQTEGDEALARRLAAEEGQIPNQSQIEADEALARQLAADYENQESLQVAENISQNAVNVANIAETLETLAPLRDAQFRRHRDGQQSTMLDAVFQQLEELVATSNSIAVTPYSPSAIESAHGPDPERPPTTNNSTLVQDDQSTMPTANASHTAPFTRYSSQEQALLAAARSGSVEAILAAVDAITDLPSTGSDQIGMPTTMPATSEEVTTSIAQQALLAAARSGSVEAILAAVDANTAVPSTGSDQIGMPTTIAPTSSAMNNESPIPLAPSSSSVPVSPSVSPMNITSLIERAFASSSSAFNPHPALAANPSPVPLVTNGIAISASSSSTTYSGTPGPDFSSYMAGVEARRTERERRRAERLAALNAVLDAHMIAGFASLDSVPPPGDSQFVDNHSTTLVWGPDAQETQCVICCEYLMEGDNVRTLPCGHVYHQDCIDLWLQRSRLCCLCKRPIDQAP